MANVTLTGLLKKAATEFPNRRAISASGKSDFTHSQFEEVVDHAASLLVASGIKPGDVVALTFPNTIEGLYVEVMMTKSSQLQRLWLSLDQTYPTLQEMPFLGYLTTPSPSCFVPKSKYLPLASQVLPPQLFKKIFKSLKKCNRP